MHVHIISSSSYKKVHNYFMLRIFLGFNLYFCSKEIVVNKICIEKIIILGVDISCTV
jgi:hypothetical protein